MKSTTLRRSNITKEKVQMMEALNRYNREHQDEDFYRNQSKSRELDALWQSFGVKQQRNEKAPQVYFVTGFICGVIITLLITTFVSILINISTPKEEPIIQPTKNITTEGGKFRFIPADNSAKTTTAPAVMNEEYTVKEGDTLESIVIRFYGSFDMNKVTLIQEANKMANPNALSIGQKLIIPINK